MVVMMRNLSLPSFLSLQFYILSILMYLYFIITKQFNLQFNQFKPLLDILYIFTEKYQPSGAGGTPSPPATPHRLPVGTKMADGVWKGVYP